MEPESWGLGKTVFGLPFGWERGDIKHVGGGIEGIARTEDAKRPRIDGEAWDWAREGFGEGARWAPP